MSIEILIPTTRTLGGATRALLEVIMGPGFQNIDAPETDEIEVELMNVEMEAWPKRVPTDISAEDLGESLKGDKSIVRTKIPLRTGNFTLFPGFVILCRHDEYEAFEEDLRARQIIGRESLELAQAFNAPEVIICGDAASDFIGHEANDWQSLKEILEDEDLPHQVVTIPGA